MLIIICARLSSVHAVPPHLYGYQLLTSLPDTLERVVAVLGGLSDREGVLCYRSYAHRADKVLCFTQRRHIQNPVIQFWV